MMALVLMSSPVPTWPVYLGACLLFVFALVVIAHDGPARRRLACGVLFAVGLLAGPLAGTGLAAPVGNWICLLMPWLLECLVF